MEASHGPPPPPPPPPLSSGGGGGGGEPDMQLPPHLQSMMREMQATLGSAQHSLHNDQQLPMPFGNSHGRGGGRGFQQHNNNRGYGRGQGGRGGGRGGQGGGQRGGGRGGGAGGRGFGGRGGGRGNNFGGRGGGRGGHYNHQRHEHHHQQQHYGQVKRKRDFDGNGAARFFLPSCLEDPWLQLLQPVSAKSLMAGSAEVPVGQPTHSMYSTTQLPHPTAGSFQQHQHHQHRHHLSYQHAPRSGRVLFQPSFLDDPWAAFVR